MWAFIQVWKHNPSGRPWNCSCAQMRYWHTDFIINSKNLLLDLGACNLRNRPDGAPTHSKVCVTDETRLDPRNASWKAEGRLLMRRRERRPTLWLNILSELKWSCEGRNTVSMWLIQSLIWECVYVCVYTLCVLCACMDNTASDVQCLLMSSRPSIGRQKVRGRLHCLVNFIELLPLRAPFYSEFIIIASSFLFTLPLSVVF